MSAFWVETERDVLRVSGADALTYLQSQVSQDIRNLGDGASAYSFVLQPTGKIDALVRIVRHSAEEFVIDTDAGFGGSVIARLNRFKIRVKVDIVALEWRCISIRNAAGSVVDGIAAWGVTGAFDLIGPDPSAPANIPQGSPADLERARIHAGWPSMGHEITDATIPAEAGVVAEAVSFTKGCYPGQELVERMDSRGSQAPRFVRLLRSADPLAVGDEVLRDAAVVGRVTSATQDEGAWIALAVVARSAQPGDAVFVDDHEVRLLASRS